MKRVLFEEGADRVDGRFLVDDDEVTVAIPTLGDDATVESSVPAPTAIMAAAEPALATRSDHFSGDAVTPELRQISSHGRHSLRRDRQIPRG